MYSNPKLMGYYTHSITGTILLIKKVIGNICICYLSKDDCYFNNGIFINTCICNFKNLIKK